MAATINQSEAADSGDDMPLRGIGEGDIGTAGSEAKLSTSRAKWTD
jgi:hypothetical protein